MTKKQSPVTVRFDRLLQMMAGPIAPSEKPAKGNRTSGKARAAGYAGTRTPAGKSANTSSKPPLKSR